MNWLDIIGHIGSALSSITFMPQVYRVWKPGVPVTSVWQTILIVFVSTLIWFVYGIGKELWPVIICNGIICGLSVVLIYFKYIFGKDKNVRSV